jgi:hypothetical protein
MLIMYMYGCELALGILAHRQGECTIQPQHMYITSGQVTNDFSVGMCACSVMTRAYGLLACGIGHLKSTSLPASACSIIM